MRRKAPSMNIRCDGRTKSEEGWLSVLNVHGGRPMPWPLVALAAEAQNGPVEKRGPLHGCPISRPPARVGRADWSLRIHGENEFNAQPESLALAPTPRTASAADKSANLLSGLPSKALARLLLPVFSLHSSHKGGD